MGFNKRFIDANRIETALIVGGLDEVYKLFKADAILCTDSKSRKVYDNYKTLSEDEIKQILKE